MQMESFPVYLYLLLCASFEPANKMHCRRTLVLEIACLNFSENWQKNTQENSQDTAGKSKKL